MWIRSFYIVTERAESWTWVADSDRHAPNISRDLQTKGSTLSKSVGAQITSSPLPHLCFLTPSPFLLDYTYECCWLITPPFVITESLPESDASVPKCIVREKFKAEILPIRRKTPNNQSINHTVLQRTCSLTQNYLPLMFIDMSNSLHTLAQFYVGFFNRQSLNVQWKTVNNVFVMIAGHHLHVILLLRSICMY